MPAVLLSGYITPVENMPTFLQYVTNVNPLKFFLVIVKGIFFKHMSFDIIFMNIIPMLIVAMITLSLANWVFNKKLD
jgi:ABC-2 type transport system permease protein